MTIRVILNYVKRFFGIDKNDTTIDRQFADLLAKDLDKGITSDSLIEHSINLYGALLNTTYSNDNAKHR